jgi:hypothetical protein
MQLAMPVERLAVLALEEGNRSAQIDPPRTTPKYIDSSVQEQIQLRDAEA